VLGGPTLVAKRDDQTGLAMGGNKTRKLEFILAEAQANGARTLVTAGAVQSNHCRQTAAAAARYGFQCILVLYDTGGAVPAHRQPGAPAAGPVTAGEKVSPSQSLSGNLLLDHLFGAQIVWAQREERDRILQDTVQAAWEAGKRPYLIPYGGSNPTGAAGYAFALKELLEQDVHPDWIVFASSSGGTQAGLVLGARMFGFKGKIIGISVDEESRVLQERVAALASMTADFLAERLTFAPDDVLVNADYLGGGYGVLGEVEKEAIELFARSEGLLLDPVYTARAAAGLADLIRRGFFSNHETVLFWHTGGTPALFAARYQTALV
jgi:1-aminocyclopropane-1-carboxylate deaminase/D-cysteine desulfhydrase-like pyridoxal-dependent ACC family enzyme